MVLPPGAPLLPSLKSLPSPPPLQAELRKDAALVRSGCRSARRVDMICAAAELRGSVSHPRRTPCSPPPPPNAPASPVTMATHAKRSQLAGED